MLFYQSEVKKDYNVTLYRGSLYGGISFEGMSF